MTSWTLEQALALAPSPAQAAAARALALPARWAGTGVDDRALWGRYRGSGAEPYEVVVDHVEVAARCSCPSRAVPCKHAIALLVLWSMGHVPVAACPDPVADWCRRRDRRAGADSATPAAATARPTEELPATAPAPDAEERLAARDDRIARTLAGLRELDRWIDDRIRTGLADPSLARYSTWDDLAARLVDAQAGALANRVRRLAGVVGSTPDWQERMLAELGVLHLLARAGARVPSLPGPLADGVATAIGWQVRQAEVLSGTPETDHWIVAGRSDTREDRIEVRRHWLYGAAGGRWAMVLSFAAYRQSLDPSLPSGAVVHADLHRYPGPATRALVGRRHGSPEGPAAPPPLTVHDACGQLGTALAVEPWIDRAAVTVRAAPTLHHGHWVLTDLTGSLPLAGRGDGLATLVAASAGVPVDITVEWTSDGVIPLTVHLPGRAVDVGPRADESFVAAA